MEDRELVHAMITLSALHRCTISRRASAIGLYYGQPRILEEIDRMDGCSQSTLAGKLNISDASAATSLKRMEKAGLLCREADATDSRKKRIHLTPAGKSALSDFRRVCEETDRMLFSGFSPEEKERFFQYTERLKENLHAEEFSLQDIRAVLCGPPRP